MHRRVATLGLAAIIALAAAVFITSQSASPWTELERQRIASLSLASLPPLPPAPSNAVADDPSAAALGQKLFFDPALSANGKVACATCHLPDRQFQDDKPLAEGVGTTTRRTMPLEGAAYSPWQFWDGRADSQWSQALGPLENPHEHGTTRAAVVTHLIQNYAQDFATVFGASPETLSIDMAFANTGKAIAAFERTLAPKPSRFDQYAAALAAGQTSTALSTQELTGLKLFIGKADCLNCHNGPLFTDNDFHNTGVAVVPGLPPDLGRAAVIAEVKQNPFNCLGPYSDAAPENCLELAFMKETGPELVRAYKTPSLRNVAQRPPFMHAGQIDTLADVVAHYNAAPAAPMGHTELNPLHLSPEEEAALIAFLATLDALPAQENAK